MIAAAESFAGLSVACGTAAIVKLGCRLVVGRSKERKWRISKDTQADR
jgi:hypothetical protein